MFKVYDAEYCGAAHIIDDECDCTVTKQYCCHASSRCHVVLAIEAPKTLGNLFFFNYYVSETSHVMPGGKVSTECENCHSFDVCIHSSANQIKRCWSVEEMIPYLRIRSNEIISVRQHDPFSMKTIVNRILDNYASENAQPIPPHEWITNEEYTEEEMMIEHPFFGNISEMVSVRMAAITELQNQVNAYVETQSAHC